MTESSIALAGIVIGILGGNLAGYLLHESLFLLTRNTLLGVFGSVFFIKTLGRLGFDPDSIMFSGEVNFKLWAVHILVSLLGGIAFVLIAKKLQTRYSQNK